MVVAGASFFFCVFFALVIFFAVVSVVLFVFLGVGLVGFFFDVVFFLVEGSFFFLGARLGAVVGGGEGE